MAERETGGRRGRQPAAVADQTRAEILEAALELFADRGFDAVSLREIAQRAGTTHGLIRHHFGSKELVWEAVVDTADRTYVAAGLPAVSAAATMSDPAEALDILLRAIVRATVAHPEFARLLLGESVRGGPRLRQILDKLAPLRAALRPVVRSLRKSGRLQEFDVDELLLFALLYGVGRFAASELTAELTGRTSASTRIADRHTDRLLRLLLPEAR